MGEYHDKHASAEAEDPVRLAALDVDAILRREEVWAPVPAAVEAAVVRRLRDGIQGANVVSLPERRRRRDDAAGSRTEALTSTLLATDSDCGSVNLTALERLRSRGRTRASTDFAATCEREAGTDESP